MISIKEMTTLSHQLVMNFWTIGKTVFSAMFVRLRNSKTTTTMTPVMERFKN